MQGDFLRVKPMALHSFLRRRPNCAMSVSVLAPLRMAVADKVSIAASAWRVPRASRGSAMPRNNSYNDGTGAFSAIAFKILNPPQLRIGIIAMKNEEN